MSRIDYIGLRVARWRDLAGMTQQQLADKAGITREYVSMIENGRRAVSKRDLLLKLARAIGVDINDLTAAPYPPTERTALALRTVAPKIRLALDGEEDPGPPRPIGELVAEVKAAMAARMACDYPRMCGLLPGLLAQVIGRVEAGPDGDVRYRATSVFVRACVTASLALKSYGLHDLGLRLAERATAAARAMDAPIYVGASQFALSQALLAVGSPRRALLIAARTADDLQRFTGRPDGLEWYGMLHLQSALVAASMAGSGADVRARGAIGEHVQEAADAARRATASPWQMEFTPANVELWRLACALEGGEPDLAPGFVRAIDRTQLRSSHRRVRLLIDTARAEFLTGNFRGAVRLLLDADALCPAEVRPRPALREIVGQMVRDARERGGWADLRTLAAQMRLDPTAEDPGSIPYPGRD